jgi:UDP-N-acetylglucosamine--N-acetylmuramyl-(pentapeptide) pyrophosphoryl-undecaprenol N-acetylglucosamine transferase
MRAPQVNPVVIAAGGTGGHFYPAEALAAELVARGRRIALMTDTRGAAGKSAVFANHEQFVLSGGGIAGHGAFSAAISVAGLSAGVVEARGILARLSPAVVVGFGGYPCIAPVIASRLLRARPPVILHEQNAVLGRANRALSRYATTVALSFAETANTPPGPKLEITGNPVRQAVLAAADVPYFPPRETVRLLVLGGSLGARTFSDIVPAALAALPDELRARVVVSQQCRPEDLDRVRAAYVESGISAELAAFFPDVGERLASAHLGIARAGASTIAELAITGRPAILVPLPHAIDDHQSANASALARAGAAWVVPQQYLTVAELSSRIAVLVSDPDLLTAAAAAARNLAQPDAARRLANLVDTLTHAEERVRGMKS